MALVTEIQNMAVFCDFENVALGVREANYPRLDIRRVLDRLLLKGDIVVKKAYCDWERYKEFKASMHEAAFELIEIPHVRMSGKNSADIRMVVDALDLCYTKAHVDCFVIISGDSDFSPLVSKLRENNKTVIGVGVRKSTSDLLTANCDEFIFYDDLVKEQERIQQRVAGNAAKAIATGKPASKKAEKADAPEAAKQQTAINLVVETIEALIVERGEEVKLLASLIKQALKRRRPDFTEAAYGFNRFGKLLEAAQKQGLIVVVRDEKSNDNVVRLSHREE